MDEKLLTTLRTIGVQGIEPESATKQGIPPELAGDAVQRGLARYHLIELQETGPGSLSVTVLMLTPAGAEAIGEDPTKIGIA